MADNPITEKSRGYDPNKALRICELVADGRSATEVCAEIGMSRPTLYRWLSLYPEFSKAYERAKQVSAQSFEDEALDIARRLSGQNDYTGTKIKALEVALAQLRWSATRRDPDRYGQRSDQGGAPIAIQINTTLNLAQDGQAPSKGEDSIYTITAQSTAPVKAIIHDEPSTADTQGGEAGPTVDQEREIADNVQRAFGVPETQRQELHRPPRGRPVGTKKGHKTPGQTTATRLSHARREKNQKRKAEEQNGD